jgi:predicted DNA-binding transcriptional regulator AlpA
VVGSVSTSNKSLKRGDFPLVASNLVTNVGLLSLRSVTIPRFALRRGEAAASLGISEALFDTWVHQQRMPRGRKIGGVVLWDVRALSAAWDSLVSEGELVAETNPFNRVVG